MTTAKFDEATDKIVALDLDEGTIIRRSVEVEHERKVAMYDLLDMNRFRPVGDFKGPYKVRLGIEDGKRIVFRVDNEKGDHLTDINLPLSPFRRIVRDYFQICGSYYDAIKKLSPSQIETIDMARRGLHNEGADVLVDALKDKIEVDKATSRRLFTLVCVLHIRG
ncbi:UPF0262 family protein [Rhodospirillaceae bacterium KN72]|uniref:UPF0262 family protein n=1 Tax=Pacificispira spongiicola TaxID=2729598 RepID=A0A7Y0E4X0_9PROT|nr:UPF0262 family protein [Pacificispira spongiicola]NMM46441.1 UPF0262 family protein [Pacificispira spongiicola]